MCSSFGLLARLMTLALLACATLAHASVKADDEHDLKAAFIANFIKFIDWPDLGDPGSKFIVGVYGSDDFERPVEDALDGKYVLGHQVVVEHLHSDAEMKKCRIVVSGASTEDRIDQLSRICIGSGTVLIGESPDFARYGGTIGFIISESHIKFDINLDAAKRAGVTISSKLLVPAHEVFREGGP
jgi:hypothetical protein